MALPVWCGAGPCLCGHEHRDYLPAPNRVLAHGGPPITAKNSPNLEVTKTPPTLDRCLLLKRVWEQTGSRVPGSWLRSGALAGSGLLSPLHGALPRCVPWGDRDQHTGQTHMSWLCPGRVSNSPQGLIPSQVWMSAPRGERCFYRTNYYGKSSSVHFCEKQKCV